MRSLPVTDLRVSHLRIRTDGCIYWRTGKRAEPVFRAVASPILPLLQHILNQPIARTIGCAVKLNKAQEDFLPLVCLENVADLKNKL